MKSLTKSTKDQKIIILNGANEEDIFKKWLDVIGMLEEDFLKFSETDGFEIRKKLLETDHNFYEISMLFKKNNVEEKIGYSFLVKADDAKELGIVVRILLCVLPYIIIQNNDFDYDEYMDKLELFSKQCKQLKMTDLYDVTERLWQYIWQYQREKHQMPNFATNCLTMFRSEKNQENLTNDISEKEQSGNNSDNVNTQSEEGLGTIIIRMLLNHIWSWVLFIISGILLVYLRKKEKDDKKGVTKR